ncbi:hypothetical protein EV183_001267 [Coemansia sp. RSA 2336]|nr:hypothetical protein EV183_001267 [Coemansia sp. RSA 2336]
MASIPQYKASDYQLNRPRYKDSLVDFIMNYHKANPLADTKLCVDVGTGTGIFARRLTSHFDKVIGTDISESMLETARQSTTGDQIEFVNVPSEDLSFLKDHSVDMLTAATGAHYFDSAKFVAEAQRIPLLMYTASETTASREMLEKATAEELRLFYAAKASLNTNVNSLPAAIPQVFADTVADHGENLAVMAVSEYQGMLQSFFVGLLGAKRILEIGTFTGSSAIFFANALQRNGVTGPDANGNKPIVSLDISEEFAAIARKNFAAANVQDFVHVMVDNAHKSLAKLVDRQFDIIFIDADKPSYQQYYETIVDNHMLAKGGLIIADNTAFDCVTPYIGTDAPVADDAVPLKASFTRFPGQVGLGFSEEIAKALHNFNEYVRKDPRSEVVMLPLFTGISLIRLLQ